MRAQWSGVKSVLGVDAAWSPRNPSGVALIADAGDGWSCVAVAPSYEAFAALAGGDACGGRTPAGGGRRGAERLLPAARNFLGGTTPTVVAVDMPLSLLDITGRRAADDCISRTFGAQNCGTHSPTEGRPGRLAAEMTQSLAAAGLPLATTGTPGGTPHRLLEVYPHPALLRLLGATERVPYTVGRTRIYWKEATAAERRARVLESMAAILGRLRQEIDGIRLDLPPPDAPGGLAALKPYEDMLDALVCAWVGAQYLAGNAVAYGDAHAAIWVPRPYEPTPPVMAPGLPARSAGSGRNPGHARS